MPKFNHKIKGEAQKPEDKEIEWSVKIVGDTLKLRGNYYIVADIFSDGQIRLYKSGLEPLGISGKDIEII